MVPELKLPDAACVAVIMEVPTPVMVTTLPAMVATAVLLLLYVNEPLLFDVGGVITKAESPSCLAGIEKLDKAGVLEGRQK